MSQQGGRNSAFMARFQGKISTSDNAPTSSASSRASRQKPQATRNRNYARRQEPPEEDGSYQQYDNDYADDNLNLGGGHQDYPAYSDDYNDNYSDQIPPPPSNHDGGRKPKLGDLDDMMLRQSMKHTNFSDESRRPPPPPQQPKPVRRRQTKKQDPSFQAPSSSDQDTHYMPSPGREPVRDRAQLDQQNKAAARNNHYQHADDPINQYYKNRPKQAPAKSRETYLDKKLKNEITEDKSKAYNEKHIHSDRDQLHFSRKARPVQYKPRNLKQWKEENTQEYVELGKLKPDLNTDELVEKRANRDRVKEFSQQLHSVNQRVCSTKSKRPPKQVVKPKSTRDKAQEYAKRVPKPRVRRPEPVYENNEDDDLLVDGEVGAEAELTALEQLEMKHNAARKEVDAIRNEMKKRGLQ